MFRTRRSRWSEAHSLMFVFNFILDFISIYTSHGIVHILPQRQRQWQRRRRRRHLPKIEVDKHIHTHTRGAPCQKCNRTKPNKKETNNMFSRYLYSPSPLRFCSAHRDKLIKWICMMIKLTRSSRFIYYYFFHLNFSLHFSGAWLALKLFSH